MENRKDERKTAGEVTVACVVTVAQSSRAGAGWITSSPATCKTPMRRSMSAPAVLATFQTTGKSRLGSKMRPSIPNSKRLILAGLKLNVAVSRTRSVIVNETEKLERLTIANASFTVLVRVVITAMRWRKFVRKATKKSILTKTMSLPYTSLRPG